MEDGGSSLDGGNGSGLAATGVGRCFRISWPCFFERWLYLNHIIIGTLISRTKDRTTNTVTSMTMLWFNLSLVQSLFLLLCIMYLWY